MRTARVGWLSTAATVVVVGLAAPCPSGADTLILTNGDILTGEVQMGELAAATSQGVVRLPSRDVSQVTLEAASGDIIELRTGRTLHGRADQPTFSIRLPSGQTVVVGRDRVGQLRLSAR